MDKLKVKWLKLPLLLLLALLPLTLLPGCSCEEKVQTGNASTITPADLPQFRYGHIWLTWDETHEFEISFMDIEGDFSGNTYTARWELHTGYESISITLAPDINSIVSLEATSSYIEDREGRKANVYLNFTAANIPRTDNHLPGCISFQLYGEDADSHIDSCYARFDYADGSSDVFDGCAQQDGKKAIDVTLCNKHIRAPD